MQNQKPIRIYVGRVYPTICWKSIFTVAKEKMPQGKWIKKCAKYI